MWSKECEGGREHGDIRGDISRIMAKPLDQFYKDCLRVGSLKCFLHFHLYLKGTGKDQPWTMHGRCSCTAWFPLTYDMLAGREELVVTVFAGAEVSPRTAPTFRAIQGSVPTAAPRIEVL